VETLTPKYRPYVEGIRQETESLGKVVTNFLSFARPENAALSRVDLEAVIRRATDDLRYELPADTKLTVDGTFAEVLGDEVLLRQVFGNLVRNAVDACEGARVTPDIRIHSWVDTAHHSCRVSVEDNGPGIPESARERIFQTFFTTRSQGTGLGLAIVQKIVVMHNGRVTVADARGGGGEHSDFDPHGRIRNRLSHALINNQHADGIATDERCATLHHPT
jgi:signal transduction histidine kinase